MLQQRPPAASAVSFIGAGLAMVAYGASAAVGLVEGDEIPAKVPATTADIPQSELGKCLGNRFEAYLYRGC
ncbi:hypothetical protein PMI14_04302 [Acidovorax sp. CF316]|uniref:hypothetical protein n=1 Tax=Acidovorax sp. CF316 TaxID=1144317 RepID=UPI00026BE523|nr:hypothetical protein [Acidovorax sp. CF316]EJE50971.1 hypothetical protein PMI14_04302 [Acidovorax sp. CF316]